MAWIVFEQADEYDATAAVHLHSAEQLDGTLLPVAEVGGVQALRFDDNGNCEHFDAVPDACKEAILDGSEPVYVMRHGALMASLPHIQVNVAA